MIPALQAKRATLDKRAQLATPAKPAKLAPPVKLAQRAQLVKPASKVPQDLLVNPVQMVLLDPQALLAKQARQEVQA